jgi:hypothetical protein
MKAPTILILLFLLTGAVFGQSAADAPEPTDLVVLEKRWHKEIRNPALDEDPFAANDEHQEFLRAQRENAIRNAVKIKEGQSPSPTLPRAQSVKTVREEPPSTRYVYRVKMKNTGSKIISGLDWDYFFFSPDTLEEAGHRSFTQKVKIRPGKDVELIGHSTSPPVRVIDATKPVKDGAARYTEKIVIRRIEYADGSVWTRLTN